VALVPLAVFAFCQAECGSSRSGASAGAGAIDDAGANVLADAGLGTEGGGAPQSVSDGAPTDAVASDGSSQNDGGDGSATQGPVYPEPGQVTGTGVLPPTVFGTTYLGKLIYDDSAIVRDLGFSGVVNGQIIWTFGDTLLLTGDGSTSDFCSSDSSGLGVFGSPRVVHDKALQSSGCPKEWIPLDGMEQEGGGLGQFAEGGTNVIEYAPNKGLVWFLKNDRGGGGTGIVGAGVATVTASAAGAVATRPDDTMWGADEPWWGDVGVTYDALDQNAYVFGHGPSTANLSNYVYLAKVSAAQATDVTAYQYWDQSASAWTTQRFANGDGGTLAVTSAQALFPEDALNQSNAFWSNYYNTWMFVYGAGVGYTDVMVMTAPNLEGPWTKGFTVASTCPNNVCSDERYAIAPHPEYDPTGKTIFVTWTDSNSIYSVKIEWQ